MENVEVVDASFWSGRRVFITGHTGFKGAWLALWLTAIGSKVRGYALAPPTEPNLFDLLELREALDHQILDIRERAALKSSITEFAPEVIFHLAAQPLVRESYLSPVETYETNVMGTVNLLDAVRAAPTVRAVVVVTTDKCYENHEWIWGYRETEPMGGYDPYSSSKGCVELAVAAFRRSYFGPEGYGSTHRVALATARAGNVIGGGDWAKDRLLPDLMRAVLAKETVAIRNPQAVRPWQHVLEPLSGYLLLAQRLYEGGPRFAEAWNFGPGEADVETVEQIVRRVCELVPSNRGYRIDGASHPHEATYLRLDCSKARELLGWRPRWTIGEAIRRVVDWTIAFEKKEDMRRMSLTQIEAYRRASTAASNRLLKQDDR